MNLQGLIDHVGEALFEQAREWAWATAARTGKPESLDRHRVWPEVVKDVPHELADLVWYLGAASWVERAALAVELYRQVPCYANLMYIAMRFDEWDEATRELFWPECRRLINDPDDRLADPMAYSLWCDFFEDSETVEEAWRQIARPDELTERGLERVLDHSGPVPWDLKVPLYERLVPDPRWHLAIFRSLLHSAFDVYGSIDLGVATRLLARLDVPDGTNGLVELRQKLRESRRLEPDPWADC